MVNKIVGPDNPLYGRERKPFTEETKAKMRDSWEKRKAALGKEKKEGGKKTGIVTRLITPEGDFKSWAEAQLHFGITGPALRHRFNKWEGWAIEYAVMNESLSELWAFKKERARGLDVQLGRNNAKIERLYGATNRIRNDIVQLEAYLKVENERLQISKLKVERLTQEREELLKWFEDNQPPKSIPRNV